MSRPDVEIAGIVVGQAALNRTLPALRPDDLAEPSGLPGWTRAHVLAHIARNADSVVHRLQGAIDNLVVDQYDGGTVGRAAEIEQTATMPLDELVAYVRDSSAEVEKLCAAVPDDAWGRLSRAHWGGEVPAAAVVYSRWQEVEIHHVDLAMGYRAGDWPEPFAQHMLPKLLAELPDRADARPLVAWLTDRQMPPRLRAWG